MKEGPKKDKEFFSLYLFVSLPVSMVVHDKDGKPGKGATSVIKSYYAAFPFFIL